VTHIHIATNMGGMIASKTVYRKNTPPSSSSSYFLQYITHYIASVISRNIPSTYRTYRICRKYNGRVDDAIREDDTHAVRVMVGRRDRSMIGNIYVVAEYIGCKNIGGGCIDDIISMAKDENEKKRLCQCIAYNAAIHGHKALVMAMIARGANDCNDIASGAASHGHMDIVMEVVDRGANNWNWIAYGAAEHGHMDIVMAMIRKGANNRNQIAQYAARGGHMYIVTKMIRKGANDWNQIAYGAAEGGHMDIVTKMIKKGANDWNGIVQHASSHGHMI
jgi:hypothetical protein